MMRKITKKLTRLDYWTVAIIANVKGETPHPSISSPDAEAEFDQIETIQAIQQAIESDGHRAVFLPAGAALAALLQDLQPDICFNIAEGAGGDAREAQVPALLEFLRIPYTGSQVLANAISLDKPMTKRIWREAGLATAPFQELITGDESLLPGLEFPLFVKPSREGTGIGIGMEALVKDESALRHRVAWIFHTYGQPALVEAFLPGREFSVGVLGRPLAKQSCRRPEFYEEDGFHRFPIEEIETGSSSTPGIYGYTVKVKDLWEQGSVRINCPALLETGFEEKLQTLARKAHQAIGAKDFSRVDIRLDAQGEPNLIEINTLPGLAPDFSDLCLMWNAEGLLYKDLILEILYLAASRFNLAFSLPGSISQRVAIYPHFQR